MKLTNKENHMAQIEQSDLELIELLKERGALVDIGGGTPGVTILVCCSDGHQFDDLYQFQCKACDSKQQHIIAAAGGPVVGIFSEYERLTHEIGGAIALGKGDSVALYAHFPCGMAKLSNLTLPEVFQRLCDTASHVRSIPGVQTVVKDFHYFDGEKQRTLLVVREKMLQALSELT
jgi:hypothetical protein